MAEVPRKQPESRDCSFDELSESERRDHCTTESMGRKRWSNEQQTKPLDVQHVMVSLQFRCFGWLVGWSVGRSVGRRLVG